VQVQWTVQTVREYIQNAGITLEPQEDVPSLRGFVMSNLCMIFLPPNTTSHIQPMDQGIIAAFKAHYRKQHVRWHVEQLDQNKDTKVSHQQALLWAHIAWDQMVTQATIRNCWRKSGLLPLEKNQQLREVEADEERNAGTKHMVEMTNLTELLGRLRTRETAVDGSESTTPENAEELLACDADEETVGRVDTYADYQVVMGFDRDGKQTMEDAEEPEAEYDPPPAPVKLEEAKACAEALHTWTLQNEAGEEHEMAVYKLCRTLTQLHVAGIHKQQTDITRYFTSQPTSTDMATD
jgi:hypothetical protein